MIHRRRPLAHIFAHRELFCIYEIWRRGLAGWGGGSVCGNGYMLSADPVLQFQDEVRVKKGMVGFWEILCQDF